MARIEGRNLNTSDTATVDAEVKITGNVAVTAIAANPDRFYVCISIVDKDAYIRLLPAATDNGVRKGIFMKKNTNYELPADNLYTGEISIINKKNGEKPVYFVTEF
ncbi:MAG: hypothetical protein JKX91_06490 [Rhizobiaceae bacterium]|nr:hypothetical protein [Rhizobiaceae bacterium]